MPHVKACATKIVALPSEFILFQWKNAPSFHETIMKAMRLPVKRFDVVFIPVVNIFKMDSHFDTEKFTLEIESRPAM